MRHWWPRKFIRHFQDIFCLRRQKSVALKTKNVCWGKGYKVRSLINHFNQRFSSSVSNDDSESISKHMVKLKDQSSMKLYVKSKSIKWSFKVWYSCASDTDNSIKLNCTRVKKNPQKKIWDQMLFWKWLTPFKIVIDIYIFYSFFNSPLLIVKLYERSLYGIGTTRKDRKGMPEMPFDRKMKRSEFEWLYSDKVACCKSLDRPSVTMLFSNLKE